MYSAVVVQEVLQRKREPWWVQRLATGKWLRAIESPIKANPLKSTREVAEELIDHSMVVYIWSKLERWKSLTRGCLMSCCKKKIISVCHPLLFYATTMRHFLIELWRATKSGFYMMPVMTSSVVGLIRGSKRLP